MVPELVSYHVFLRQWPTARTELGAQHVEKAGVEVGGLIDRAVEWAHLGAGRATAGIDLTTEQPHPRPGVSAQQLLPHRVDGVAGGDHTALHVLVGVGPGAALAQIEPGRDVLAGARRRELGGHFAGIDPEQQRDHEEQQPAESAAERDSSPSTASGRCRRAGVDLHTLIEGHRTLRCGFRRGWWPGKISFAHYDSGVPAVAEVPALA